ncbi:MAG: hypothetical protein HY851_02385 [candidate division Zixibacteria bacterium]|nr:hypothetical protein [candidate division Zixibacteria bacterium]
MRLAKLLCVAALVVAMATLGSARDMKTDNQTIAAEGAKRLDINCRFGAGILTVRPVSTADAARIDARYDADRIDLDVDYRVRGETGRLDIESEHHGSNVETDDNQLTLNLSDKLPTDLSLKIGAAEGDVDLGGIPLSRLDLDIGAASGVISFSKPNPQRLEEASISIGASSANLRNFGNANFDRLTCKVGAASSDLDFRGEYHGESEIILSVGVASAEVILPIGVPIRVESSDSHFFSSVDIHGGDLDEIDDDIWESPGYQTAKDRILLRVKVGMGSVDLRWKK